MTFEFAKLETLMMEESNLRRKRGRPSKNTEGMNPDDKGVCERIAFIIERSGDTQIEAAEKIGTQQTAISRIINYKNAPSITMLKKFIKAYDANPMYVLFNDKSKGYHLKGGVQNSPDMVDKDNIVNMLTGIQNHISNYITGLNREAEDGV